jgi:hypothetical protein
MIELVFYWWNPPNWGEKLSREARVVGHETDYEHRYHIYICGVLVYDCHSTASCIKILDEIGRLERREQESFFHSGNAWTKTVTREGVQIDSHTVPWWDEQPEGHFTLAEFKAALEGWKRFLQMPISLESRLQIALPEEQ